MGLLWLSVSCVFRLRGLWPTEDTNPWDPEVTVIRPMGRDETWDTPCGISVVVHAGSSRGSVTGDFGELLQLLCLSFLTSKTIAFTPWD